MNVVASKPQRLALIVGASALAAMGILTVSCSTSPKETPTPPGTSSSPPVEPTAKYTGPVQPQPSFSDRGSTDSTTCRPGTSKVNGICKKG